MELEKFNVKPKWWHAYRHTKNRPRLQMSLEMIVRRSFGDVLREYLQHCSLVGIKQLCERDIPIRHRIMWFILIVSTYGAVIYMLMNIWSATLKNPLIVTMDSSTFPIGEIDFPAIAICNANRISMKAVKQMARELYADPKQTSSLHNIEWFLLQGGRLLDFSYNETLRLRLLTIANNPGENGEAILNGMRRLAPDCDEMLLRCAWAGKVVACSDIFTVRRTVLGHCCAFNFVLEYNAMGRSVFAYGQVYVRKQEADGSDIFTVRRTVLGHCCAFNYVLEYNSMGRPDKAKSMMGRVMRQKEAGWKYGLIVVLDPLLEDYAYPIRNLQGFDLFLFDPTHFADPSGGRVVQRVIEPTEVTVLELRSVKQIATEEVRKYPLSIRKCLFHDEVPKHFGTMYSYSACVVRCRIKTIRSLCKCTPYFLPTRRNGTTCSLVDLQCLNKYKEKLVYMYPFHASSTEGLEMELLDSLYCPECLPDCELTKHSTKSFVIPFTKLRGDIKMPSIMEGLNITKRSNIAVINIYQPTNDGVLDRLDVVFYWYEILSNVGGFAGILVGFSIISVFEIVYYFIVRFIQVFCTNFRMYY